MIARADGRCEYCLAPQKYSNAPLAVEHIYPIAHGGLTVMGNLAFACTVKQNGFAERRDYECYFV